jgi:hypothetical protein
MTDQAPLPEDRLKEERFKAAMPAIPGVGTAAPKSAGVPAPIKVVGGLVGVVLAIVVVGVVVSKTHKTAPAVDPLPQVDVPAPDLGNPPPQVPPPVRGIASVDSMSKPWSSLEFDYRDAFSGQHVPALLLRLPIGAANQPSGYWAISLKAPYGNCQLEYVSDLEKLKTDYGYRAAKHPMVGNPCSRTVFDPLKTSNLAGNVWIRGGIVQGSDLRPPLGIEVKIEGKEIFTVRME